MMEQELMLTWEQRKLGEIADYRNGDSYENQQANNGQFELINLNSISIDGGLKPSGRFIDDPKETLKTGDLVMVLSDIGHGDLLGRVAIIPDDNKYVLNQRVALLRIKERTIPSFLSVSINSNQKYFKLQGAGSSQLNISKGTVENCIISLPPIKEQKKIGSFVASLDFFITLHQCKYSDLKTVALTGLFP